MERKRNKGFTLVELIVVLVILAILAAVMVPTMIGWIDKAKEKKILLAARSLYTASQAVLSEEYAMCSDPSAPPTTDSLKNSGRSEEILKLAGTPEGDTVSCSIGVMGGDSYGNYIVQYAYYSENATGIAVYFNGSSWETVEEGTDVSKADICLKGTPVRGAGPGAWATELVNSGKYATENDRIVLSTYEQACKEAVEMYNKYNKNGRWGYQVDISSDGTFTLFSNTGGEDKGTQNMQTHHEKNSNDMVTSDSRYMVVVKKNEDGTISVGSSLIYDNATQKVKNQIYRIYLIYNHTDFYGFTWEDERKSD